MKTFLFLSLNMYLFIGLFCLLPQKSYGQDNQDPLNQSFNEWRHMEKYNSIIQQSIFSPGMSDDEMAGIELWRGGRNLKMAFSFEVVGVVVASTAAWLPKLIIGKKYKGNMTEDDIRLIIGAVSSGFFIVAVCELVSGYNKIGKAGIIFQHKKFQIKTKGNSVSLNF